MMSASVGLTFDARKITDMAFFGLWQAPSGQRRAVFLVTGKSQPRWSLG